MSLFPDAPVIELLTSLPQLARLGNAHARLQAAVAELAAHGFEGIQLVMFGRRLSRLSVRHGTLPFWFEPELASRSRRALREWLSGTVDRHGIAEVAAADLATLADYGRPPGTAEGGLYLVPLTLEERLLGILSFSDRTKLDEAGAKALKTWSDVLATLFANDVRISNYEELEHLMRLLRREHDIAGVLNVVVESLANEYGATCEAWRRDRSSWLQMAVCPLGRRIDGVDLSALVTGEESVLGLGNAVGVPLVVEERLWGALVLDERFLDGEHWHFLRNVARHSELALENAMVFERHRQFAQESAALSEAGRTLLGYTRVEPLATAIARLAVELGEAEHAALYLENGVDDFYCAGNFPRNIYRPFDVGHDELRALLQDQTSLVERPDHVLLLPFGDRSTATERNALRGCLAIARPAESAMISQETVRLLEAFATLGTLALRNARLYEESTEANRALGESNAFKDDLLAMFTHDFKGPLTVISGYGELVLEKLNGEERESVAIILAQVGRLATLADDALALARAQAAGFALERTPGALVAFIRELLTLSFGTESDRLRFMPRVEEIWLTFDPHAMRHVFENIVGNALKYSKGEVTIEILRERNEASVVVRDRGIGIPPDELVHVFGRFARASNARRQGISGSGVGLYIANRIVEEHGGAIFVSSCEGEGSTFEVRLPLAN